MDSKNSSAISHSPSATGIAVIGAGYWGPNLIRNFASLPGCRLAAVCDLNPARLDPIAKQYGVHTTTRLEEVLADPTIEAVAVATPAATHYAIAKKCLKHDKHVLVEKPFALDVEQGEELVHLAEKRGRVLMVDHIFLYNPTVNRLAELIQEGKLGELRYIRAVRTSLGPRLCEDTNIVWDAQIHEVYILMHLLGTMPIRVVATGGAFVRPDIEDVVFTTLFFPDGVVANCHNTSYAPLKERRMILVGSRGMAIYDDLHETAKITLYERGYAPFEGVDTVGNQGVQLFDNGSYVPEITWREPLLIECQHFLDCIRENRTPLSDGVSALRVLQVLQAIDTSLKAGGQRVSL